MSKKILKHLFTVSKRIVTIYLLLAIIIYFCQSYLIFHPRSEIFQTPGIINLEYEDVYLTPDSSKPKDKIHGWFVPAKEDKGTVLFFHGNAYNIAYRLDSIKLFNELGYNCLMIDYRGYGLSEGEISEANMYADALTAWEYLLTTRKIPKNKIILHGRSLGGGVVSKLAVQVQPQALVLESTFTSLPDLAQEKVFFLPVKKLCRNKFNTIARLNNINCPVLFIHSTDDQLIPISHGRKLYTSYQGKKTFCQISGDHNFGFLASGSIYYKPLEKFYNSAVSSDFTASETTGIVQ